MASASEDELARLANNWSAVQSYYVAYHAFQAYLQANGEARPQSHPKTQTMFADRWAARALDLPPWSFSAGDGVFRNGPAGRGVDLSVHPWKNCDTTNCWDIAGIALKSTRDDAVAAAMRKRRETKRTTARREWQREETNRIAAGRRARKVSEFALPHLSATEKADVQRRVRPFKPMDYLYRLRVQSNYEDSTVL